MWLEHNCEGELEKEETFDKSPGVVVEAVAAPAPARASAPLDELPSSSKLADEPSDGAEPMEVEGEPEIVA